MKDAPTPKRPQPQPNNSRPASDSGRDYSSRSRGTVDWQEIDPALLQRTITTVTKAGCAIILGTTRDRGAYSIVVLDGDTKIREYGHTTEEISDTLSWLVSLYSTD